MCSPLPARAASTSGGEFFEWNGTSLTLVIHPRARSSTPPSSDTSLFFRPVRSCSPTSAQTLRSSRPLAPTIRRGANHQLCTHQRCPRQDVLYSGTQFNGSRRICLRRRLPECHQLSARANRKSALGTSSIAGATTQHDGGSDRKQTSIDPLRCAGWGGDGTQPVICGGQRHSVVTLLDHRAVRPRGAEKTGPLK